MKRWVVIFREISTGETQPFKVKAPTVSSARELGRERLASFVAGRADETAWEFLVARETER